jgi:DNA-binding LytR/AlgR family response regulator
VDYLVKPVELDRFIKACNKAFELHQLRVKSKTSGDQQAQDYFFVNVEYSLVKVQKQDILYIEGLKDYLKIHLKGTAKPIITRLSIKAIEEQLPSSQFVRIHKSYIVSVAAITSIRKNSVFLGETELPVSDNYRDAFFRLIGRAG